MEDCTLTDIHRILGREFMDSAAKMGARWCEFMSERDFRDVEKGRIAPEEEARITDMAVAYHALATLLWGITDGGPEELTPEQWDAYIELVESQSEEYIPNE